MKIRTHARRVAARMHRNLFWLGLPIPQWLVAADMIQGSQARGYVMAAPAFSPDQTILDQLAFMDISAQPAAEPESVPLEYHVARRRDDLMVAVVSTREEALALVIKHQRQKKAALQVFLNGEPVLFSEEEYA